MEDELKSLRTMCDEGVSREERSKLIESCARHVFAEPEHHVVFDSIRALFPRGEITAQRLMVHLTNRGFPDIDVDKYLTGPRVA